LTSPSTPRARHRVRVIYNPSAGTRPRLPAESIEPEGVRELLSRHDVEADIVVTESEAEGRAAVRGAIETGCGTIVAAGGDGTFGLVAGELIGSDVAIGILPIGRAMNVARSLSIPRELEQAAAILAAGHERVIDVGLAGGRMFHEIASVGLSAEILGLAHAFDKGHHGSALELIRVLTQLRRVNIRLRLDDRAVQTRALMVVVANGPYTGLGLTLAPEARLDDGELDVRIYRRFSRVELLRHFWSIAFGRRAYAPEVVEYRARRVVLETPGLPVRADAFDLGKSPIEFGVHARALRVIAPPAG
jgi:diacylglycerol kinase (ATP)